jgi:hypothetical protein
MSGSPDRPGFRVPWDEKTGPGRAPERVEVPRPWDESVPEMPGLPLPRRKQAKKPRQER